MGELIGKIRSTPIPKLTRRTVKVAPERCAALADDHSFKRLNAFLFAFGFFQPDVHTHRITRAERGDIFPSLVLSDLLKYATHMDSPGQTRYGGASATEDGVNYSEIRSACTGQILTRAEIHASGGFSYFGPGRRSGRFRRVFSNDSRWRQRRISS